MIEGITLKPGPVQNFREDIDQDTEKATNGHYQLSLTTRSVVTGMPGKYGDSSQLLTWERIIPWGSTSLGVLSIPTIWGFHGFRGEAVHQFWGYTFFPDIRDVAYSSE